MMTQALILIQMACRWATWVIYAIYLIVLTYPLQDIYFTIIKSVNLLISCNMCTVYSDAVVFVAYCPIHTICHRRCFILGVSSSCWWRCHFSATTNGRDRFGLFILPTSNWRVRCYCSRCLLWGFSKRNKVQFELVSNIFLAGSSFKSDNLRYYYCCF